MQKFLVTVYFQTTPGRARSRRFTMTAASSWEALTGAQERIRRRADWVKFDATDVERL